MAVLVYALGAALLSVAFAQEGELPPLRDLPRGRTYELRVLYLEDGRLPTLTEAQRKDLYAKIQRLLGRWYSYRVEIRDVGRRDLNAYFTGMESAFKRSRAQLEGLHLDPDLPKDVKEIRETIRRDFEGRELALIQSYLRGKPPQTKEDALALAHEQFLSRLRELRAIQLPDASAFFDASRPGPHSYPHWTVLLRETRDADLIFTNSMILGADKDMPIYVIARGGVTTGVTNNNPGNAYQGASMVGLFPFLSDAPVFLRERGALAADDRLEVIATFAMHELGHLFLRFAEHYDHPGCVHAAPKWLNYVDWHAAIRKAGTCRLSHRKLRHF